MAFWRQTEAKGSPFFKGLQPNLRYRAASKPPPGEAINNRDETVGNPFYPTKLQRESGLATARPTPLQEQSPGPDVKPVSDVSRSTGQCVGKGGGAQ